MIKFAFNPEKFVNTVAWFAQQCPACTKLKICKLLYYADKEHLIRYQRPIIGDTYYKLPNGPVPSYGLNMLRGKSSDAYLALLRAAVEVKGWQIIPKKDPDMSVFSKSDIKILEEIRDNFGKLDAYAVRDKSHKESWWDKIEYNSRIDFELLIDGNDEQSQEARRFLEEDQSIRDAIRPYGAVI